MCFEITTTPSLLGCYLGLAKFDHPSVSGTKASSGAVIVAIGMNDRK
jgi:hypothetical protein